MVANQFEATKVTTTVSTELPNDTTPYTALYLIGTRALSQCAATQPDCPLIPINSPPIPESLSATHVTESLHYLETGEFTARSYPTLSVTLDTQHVTTGLFDILLTATQVAEILSFAIHTDEFQTQFRADGLAFGTPIGTHGYLRAAGAPLIEPNTNAIVGLPLGQFDLQKSHWVFSPTTTITVERLRDSSPLTVLTDGTNTNVIDADQPLEISITDQVSFLTFPALSSQ
jgi:NAD+ kinase